MQADEFEVIRIPQLSISGCTTSRGGWLCFCQSRGGNSRFFNWIVQTVVVELALCMRERAHPDYKNSPLYLTVDGEHAQLSSFFEPDTKSKVESEKIIFGKAPASTSGVFGNALDVGNFFKAGKTKLRSVTDGSLENENPKLVETFQSHIRFLRPKLSAHSSAQIAQGIVRILEAYKSLPNRERMIRKSFDHTGLHPLNYRVTLSRCSTILDYSTEEYNKMINLLPSLSKCFAQSGQVTEVEFDRLGFPQSLAEKTDRRRNAKHERPLTNQRAVILSHNESVKRYAEELVKKQEELRIKAEKKAERKAKKAEKKQEKPEKQAEIKENEPRPNRKRSREQNFEEQNKKLKLQLKLEKDKRIAADKLNKRLKKQVRLMKQKLKNKFPIDSTDNDPPITIRLKRVKQNEYTVIQQQQ